ncbi:urease accessory protein UreD [Methylobacterium sp. BTF04]|uniref:urease accessory protein UreD n=1 Tax=Methylobacterium sp. BTF04 TaxID=2708300 RepID=UPI0032B2DC42
MAPEPTAKTAAPARQRSDGRIRLSVVRMGDSTRIRDLAEAGPSRLRLPRRPVGPCEAVLLNTAGGIACGDRFSVAVEVGPGADLVLTTTAAEKIYRSDGPVSIAETRVTVEAGGRLAYLPQETILFDGAALRRRFEADLASDAHLLAFEAITFGRTARDEDIRHGTFADVWRIRRDGRLVYADSLSLEGPITAHLARTAIAGGARAMATLIDVSPDAEGRIEEVRALLEASGARVGLPAAGSRGGGVEAGASAWNGHLVVRCLSADPDTLRSVTQRVLVGYRGMSLPRVWQT